MSWRDVSDAAEAEYGARYRTSIPLAAWCYPAVSLGAVQAALAIGKKIAGDRVRIVATEIFPPGKNPSNWTARGFRATDWGVRVTWEKVAGGTPVLIYAGAVAGVIAVATLSWVVVAKFTEQEFAEFNEEVRKTSDTVKDFLKETLFNPGVIISALVAVALMSRNRR